MGIFWGLRGAAGKVFRKYAPGNLKIALAESCTGGLAAALLTSFPGSSSFFLGSAVVYSNHLKTALLGVPAEMLEEHGAVSYQTAGAMARGMARISGAQVTLSVTGIAGPGGGSTDKPVGLVWFSWCIPGETKTWKRTFVGNRHRIQKQAVREVYQALLKGPPVDSRLN